MHMSEKATPPPVMVLKKGVLPPPPPGTTCFHMHCLLPCSIWAPRPPSHARGEGEGPPPHK